MIFVSDNIKLYIQSGSVTSVEESLKTCRTDGFDVRCTD